jgi:hypothetical protein
MYNNRYKAGTTSKVTGTSVSDAIAKIEHSMGVQYVGWSDTIDGYPIPKELSVTTPPNTLFTTRIATNNLMSLPKNPNVMDAIKANNTIPIVGFQEASPISFKKALKRRYPNIIGLGPLDNNTYAAPLVVNTTKFRHISTGSKIIHRGVAHVSLTRRLTWAIVEHRRSKTRFAVINLHAVVVKRDKYYTKRVEMRQQDKAVLKSQVDIFLKSNLPVIITGDFNTKANWLGAIYNGHRVQRVQNGIDQILAVDSSNRKWTFDRFNTEDTSSDHDVLRAKVHLSGR